MLMALDLPDRLRDVVKRNKTVYAPLVWRNERCASWSASSKINNRPALTCNGSFSRDLCAFKVTPHFGLHEYERNLQRGACSCDTTGGREIRGVWVRHHGLLRQRPACHPQVGQGCPGRVICMWTLALPLAAVTRCTWNQPRISFTTAFSSQTKGRGLRHGAVQGEAGWGG